MKDKELRKLIGSRAKQRRLELNLTQPYVAEKMGVTASTILRYENGSIDNTKKMVLEGLSEALHVSIEWLRGETDEYETDITDKKELQIRDAMGDILKQLPLDLSKKEDAFSKDLLLLMLKQYNLFLESFQFACKNYKGNTNEADIAKVMGFESNDEYNEIMFLREITHTVNAFNDMADIVRLYSKKPEMAEDKEAAAQFAPQEYKDLWMCACGEVNHKDEEKCAACGAEYGPQHALFEDEEKLKENLEAYNKAEAEKAEAARIAAEKKAAEEKAAAEAAARKAAEEKAAAEEAARKKRLHRKIFLSISIPLAVLIAAFVVVLIVYIIPQNHYNDAAALLEAGKYDEAITAFTALDGYSDSAARITEAEYKKACDLLENEKFAEAIEAFTALGDYEDSKDRITEAEYRRAVKTFESGAYEDALNLLEPLKDYKDAAEKIETCHYELGMKALEADNLKSAAAHFKEVNAEQNKKMQAAFCDKGIAFYEKGDEEKALTYFEYVTDKDLLPKIDAAYYAQALKLVEDGEYDKATEIFAKLGEYEDCPTQLLRIHALKAEQYYNNADYENAIAEFKAAGDYGDAASRVTEATYRLGAQQLANGEVRKAYDTLYPIRSYDPAYMLLVSNSQFYIQIYDVGAGPNPLNEN